MELKKLTTKNGTFKEKSYIKAVANLQKEFKLSNDEYKSLKRQLNKRWNSNVTITRYLVTGKDPATKKDNRTELMAWNIYLHAKDILFNPIKCNEQIID